MRTRGRFLVAAVIVGALAAPALPAAARTAGGSKPVTHKDFDRHKFSTASATVDNRWLPLVPGTQFVYDGTANRGKGTGAHRVIFTVTDVTKSIDGVRTAVIWDRDVQDGELVEEELAFVAQDGGGNVWNLGEYPEEHENGKFAGAPNTWLSGRQRAAAGVAMRAEPKEGTSSYLQGYAPEIQFEDKARVSKEHQHTCVPAGCYDDVLVVDEWNPLEQPDDGHQFKFHAPGVGVVRIEARGGVEQETLVLTKLRHLSGKELAEARQRALELDQHAYKVAKDVYRGTSPAS
ncbi:MAG TPA: hypothetical protein VG034_00460 [Acidimicrobiia bacterium]|jgi:hypothetical protein|nr:hypothetical protein [Acidimicrobiia bacterium]